MMDDNLNVPLRVSVTETSQRIIDKEVEQLMGRITLDLYNVAVSYFATYNLTVGNIIEELLTSDGFRISGYRVSVKKTNTGSQWYYETRLVE